MVIALAGRRTDASDAEVARFPLAQNEVVRERLHDLFVDRGATALVCSGACGADLLALDVAGRLGLQRRMVLASDRAQFRSNSVTDRPGDWGPLFDRIADALARTGNLVVSEQAQEAANPYAATNSAILSEALELARNAQPHRGMLAVAVWEGAARGEGDMTAHFLRSAQQRGLETATILTR
ncbi:MAG: hypothetical protein AAF933_10165 [Pseudomonadota bacterium]